MVINTSASGIRREGASSHLPYLDGLRGIAAGWVFLHHVAILSAVYIPVIANGSLAVDLFMILSGFLMAYHYINRQDKAPWTVTSTWTTFWRKRFFRIVPLYYTLLIAAFLTGPYLGAARRHIASVFPGTATDPARYYDGSIENFLAHVSFIFGVLPDYSFRTPLPDWSIGLEMQFYLLFPFIMLLWKRLGVIMAVTVLITLCVALKTFAQPYWDAFPMPSMLALKLHVFLAGSLLAKACLSVGRSRLYLIAFAFALPVVTALLGFSSLVYALAQTLMIGAFSALAFHDQIKAVPILGLVSRIGNRILDTSVLRWLGDTSYSVYLVHLLLLLPIAAWLVEFEWYVQGIGLWRFAICLVIAVPPIYLVATLLFYGVEKKGIHLGQWLGRQNFSLNR